MQQQNMTSEDGENQEADWTLATYGQRVGAWLLDALFVTPLMFALVLLVLMALFLWLFAWYFGDWSDNISANVPIILWAALALFLALMAFYIVWWLFALGRGQTPGKQVVGIRVIRDNGEPSGWGYTFLREFVIKFLLIGFLTSQTLGVALLVDHLWPLWDRAKKMQTLHDKMLGTVVVQNRN